MINLKFIKLILLSILLVSCIDSYQTMQVTAENKTRVHVYYPKPPSCQYEVLGYIEVNGFYYKKSSLFKALAEEAEKLKADGVVIGYLEQLDIKEYVASAEAIRCKNKEEIN